MFNSIKNSLLSASKVTHAIVLAIVTAAAFVTSNAGQAVIMQYPKISTIGGLIVALAAVVGAYRKPS